MALSKVILNGSTLMDVTDTTAVAADVASGKYFYGADGVKTAGSASGGLEYETGTWTPTEDVARAEISFINVHTTRPIAIILADATGTSTAEESTMIYWAFSNWYDAFGAPVFGMNNTTGAYGGLRWAYSSGTSYAANGLNISGLSGSGHIYMDYNVTTAKFFPYGGSYTYTFKAGRTYKWIAVWAPTT